MCSRRDVSVAGEQPCHGHLLEGECPWILALIVVFLKGATVAGIAGIDSGVFSARDADEEKPT